MSSRGVSWSRNTTITPASSAAIRAIALNTFREAIRDRILYLLLVFALGLIGVSRLLSLLTVSLIGFGIHLPG